MMLKSYGRRQGRKQGAERAALLEELLPQLSLDLNELKGQATYPDFIDQRYIWVEIGSGAGENLYLQALNFPNILHIGCEVYRPGLSQTIKYIKQFQLSNVRLWPTDARLLLQELADKSINKLFILFPDPWPKKRQHKRRLIQPEFLALCAKKLKGELIIATDHPEYARWIMWQTALNQDFTWQAQEEMDWHIPPEVWQKTKYQQKALAGSHAPFFLYYKICHKS